MTSQPEPVPRDATPANQITNPLREIAALVLLAANALLLFVGLMQLAVPYSTGDSFGRRADEAFVNLVGLAAVALPVLAVLLATHVHPPVRRAKLITLIALGEYAVSAVLAVVAFLGWLVGGLGDAAFRSAFTGLLTRVAYLAIFAIAAFVVFKVWRALYYRPRRIARPGAYGQPGVYGQPANPQSAFPPGYPPPPAYDPNAGVAATPGPGPAPGYGPTSGQPGYEQRPVPAQPAPSRTPAGDETDETQVLNRPEDQSGGIAATQTFEPVQSDRDPHRSSEQRGDTDPPRR